MYKRWVEFRGKANKRENDAAHVTLNRRGALSMNNIAFESIGSPDAVTLHYDKNNGFVGLLPCEAEKENAFPVSHKNKGRLHIVYGIPFFKHNKIAPEQTIAFNKPAPDEGGYLVLDLGDVTELGSKT